MMMAIGNLVKNIKIKLIKNEQNKLNNYGAI